MNNECPKPGPAALAWIDAIREALGAKYGESTLDAARRVRSEINEH